MAARLRLRTRGRGPGSRGSPKWRNFAPNIYLRYARAIGNSHWPTGINPRAWKLRSGVRRCALGPSNGGVAVSLTRKSYTWQIWRIFAVRPWISRTSPGMWRFNYFCITAQSNSKPLWGRPFPADVETGIGPFRRIASERGPGAWSNWGRAWKLGR